MERAPRARGTKFHASLKPAHRFAGDQRVHAGVQQVRFAEHAEAGARVAKTALDFVLAELGTQVGAAHMITATVDAARLGFEEMIGGQSGAQRSARVSGGGLNPDASNFPSRRILPLATQFRATPPARHRFFDAGFAGQRAASFATRFLRERSEWMRPGPCAFGSAALDAARRPAEKAVELAGWSWSGRRSS